MVLGDQSNTDVDSEDKKTHRDDSDGQTEPLPRKIPGAQEARDNAITRFDEGEVQALVATAGKPRSECVAPGFETEALGTCSGRLRAHFFCFFWVRHESQVTGCSMIKFWESTVPKSSTN